MMGETHQDALNPRCAHNGMSLLAGGERQEKGPGVGRVSHWRRSP